VSLAGCRLPCGYCQQIINRFIIANQGKVKLDYVKAQDEPLSEDKSKQKVEPQNYDNALNTLSDKITESSINDKFQSLEDRSYPPENNWLKRMLPVINFDLTRRREGSVAKVL